MPSSATVDGSTKYVYQFRVNLHCPEPQYNIFRSKIMKYSYALLNSDGDYPPTNQQDL